MNMPMTEFLVSCEREVARLHLAFSHWYRAEVAPDDDQFTESIANAFAPDFVLVSASGSIRDRETVLRAARNAYGNRRETPFDIATTFCSSQQLDETIAIVVYKEWQTIAGLLTGRTATAVFSRNDGLPGGVEWLHVHETWLEGHEGEVSRQW